MFRVCLFFICFSSCSGIIYDLNDTEYARMPPLWQLAAFEPCMAANGTYCLLQLSLAASEEDPLMHIIQEYSAHTSKHYDHAVVERGVCVADACRARGGGGGDSLEACVSSSAGGGRLSALRYCVQHDERAHADACRARGGGGGDSLEACVSSSAGGGRLSALRYCVQHDERAHADACRARGGGGGDSLEACVSSSAGGGRLSALRYCVQHDERAHADACRARGGGGGDSLEACVSSSAGGGRLSALRYCVQHDERAHADAWDCAVRALLLALVALCALGTLYDYRKRTLDEKNQQNGNPVLLCFSVKRNWERLTSNEVVTDPKIRELQFLHGIRVIANLCVLMMHAVMYYAVGFTDNPHDVEKSYDVVFYQLSYHGLMLVQLFFFMSGFLLVFYLRAEEERRKFSAWDVPKIMILRLSRLVPGLAMTLALLTSWVRHAGSGPLWRQFVTDGMSAYCRRHWWHNLLFINNYTEDGKHCIMPTWHLAADMQVFLVGVTVYVMMPRWRRTVLCALLVVGTLAPALHTVLQDLDLVFITPEAFRTLESRPFWLQHALGHNNLPCFVMGMLTVSPLYRWREQGGHHAKNRWHAVTQYLALVSIPLLMYSSVPLTAGGARASLATRAVYSATIRLLYGAVCAAAAPSFFTSTSTYLKRFLCWGGWLVPSRLSYCVYLLHMPLLLMMLGSNTELTHFSFANTMKTTLTIVMISFLSAVPMYLMVEAPFNALFKVLAGKYFHKPSDVHETLKIISNGDFKVNGASKDKSANVSAIVNGNALLNSYKREMNGNGTSIIKNSNGSSKVNEVSLNSNGKSRVNVNSYVNGNSCGNGNSLVNGNSCDNGNSLVNGNSCGNGNSHVNGNSCGNGNSHVNGNSCGNGNSHINGNSLTNVSDGYSKLNGSSKKGKEKML